MVHKLPPVGRVNVILPEAILKLLDRKHPELCRVSHTAAQGSGNRPARESCCMGRPAPERLIPFAILPANLPGHTTLIINRRRRSSCLGAYMKSCPPCCSRPWW